MQSCGTDHLLTEDKKTEVGVQDPAVLSEARGTEGKEHPAALT